MLSGCNVTPALPAIMGKTVKISIVYGSEKQAWLEPLVKQFNDAKHKTPQGATVVVEANAIGSIEAINQIIAGQLQPTVWSPASSLYIPVANAEWHKSHSDDLVTGKPNDLVLSPVVVAMWKPMAEALGWPQKPLGWADIAQLAVSDKGWAAYGYPEWGAFKFGHTHPNYSNSGLVSILAEAYAGAGKRRGLTVDDLNRPEVKAFVSNVESSIIHYGTSTGFFADRMFERGPSYLSAAVLYENLVVAQESKRLAGQSSQLPVVAIYPKEGTFWSNHPYAILNAPWVTDEHKAAAEVFETFLRDRPQQLKALELGFRPADTSVSLTTPLDAQHGVDPSQPQTILIDLPSAEVIQAAQATWKQTKKPVDVSLVIDVSGSMAGEKISSARNSLVQFINLLDEDDRVQVVAFSTSVNTIVQLTSVGAQRDAVIRRVSGIIEGGNTQLYGATLTAYNDLKNASDPKHIRAVVVLSDGQDNASKLTLDQLVAQIGASGEDSGSAIKLFTIAFGKDADKDILSRMAEATGGKTYAGDPKTINQVYAEIATFF